MKTRRTIVFELDYLVEKQKIILGYIAYHAGKLRNQAKHLVKNRLANPDYGNSYNKLTDTSLLLRSL